MINLDLENIAKEDQADVLAAFWVLLRECEALADNTNDAYLQRQVEGSFRLWNRVTGQDHKPRWIERKK